MRMQICAALLALCSWPARGVEVEVRHVSNLKGAKTSEGVFFALPRTIVAADVSVDAKLFKPGMLAKYAIVYFPEIYKNKVNPENESRRFALKDVALSSRGEPDPDWVFWMNLKSGWFTDRAVTMQMSEAGAVTGASSTVDNTLPDFLLGVLGSATGIASKAMLMGDGAVESCKTIDSQGKFLYCRLMRMNQRTIEDYRKMIQENPAAAAASRKVLAEIEEADTEPPDASGKKRKIWRMKPDSELEKADKLFDSCLKLEKAKIEAVSEPSPGVGVSDRLAQMDVVRAAIKNQFTGTTETLNWAGRFEFRPEKEVGSWNLMNLDSESGACVNGALFQGKTALPKEFFDKRTDYKCPDGASYTLKVNPTASQVDLFTPLGSTYKVKEYDKAADRGLPYRVPAEIRFSVTADDKPTPYFANLLVAQRGLVLGLSAKMGGRQTKAGLTYFDSTGAIKTLDTSGKTILNKSIPDAIGTGTAGVIDAKINRDKPNDPLAQLIRQRQLLEEEQKIKKICGELGRTDCTLAGQPQ